jgi:hypothetical protein
MLKGVKYKIINYKFILFFYIDLKKKIVYYIMTFTNFFANTGSSPFNSVVYNNYLYVTSSAQGGGTPSISRININNPINDNSPTWYTNSNIQNPIAICVDSSGNLYIGDVNTNYISQLNINTLAFSQWFNISDISNNINPVGITIDSTSTYIYVSCSPYNGGNPNNNQIVKIKISDKTFTSNWASIQVGQISGNSTLAIYGNYIYVANTDINSISKISLSQPSSDFNLYWAYTRYGTRGVTIDSSGNYLYSTSFDLNTSTTAVGKILLSNPTLYNNQGYAQSSNCFGITFYNGYIYVTDVFNNLINYLYVGTPCFKKDTKILTNKGYRPIQDLRKGDLIKTLTNGFVAINMIGKREIYHPAREERIKEQLYKCSKNKYPEIFEDLIITGCHCILIDDFKDEKQREKTLDVNGDIYITEKKYRLPACVDERASVYEIEGNYTIYHMALDNDSLYRNYGIFANGLLVETCSKRYLKVLSNMTLIE